MTALYVWTLEISSFPDDFHRDWLSAAEREKELRFATPHLQKEYLLTRVLVRGALSKADPSRAPASWVFERTAADKPFVSGGGPSFNVSNAGDLVACIVSTSRANDEVGIDVEPAELPDVETWTAREAYLKARGEGISVRPDRVPLSIKEGVATFVDGKNLDDDAAEWTIRLFRAGSRADHVLAVAIRGGSPEIPVIRSWPKEA